MIGYTPFYSSLLRKPLTTKKKATASHVLMYGAIEQCHGWPKGCIGSNAALGKMIGVAQGTAANLISDLVQAGWVSATTKENGMRDRLIPNGTIKFETSQDLHSTMNPPSFQNEHIETVNNPLPTVVAAEAANDKVLTQLYRVFRFYSLVVGNNRHVPGMADKLKKAHGEEIAELYLVRLQERDLRVEREKDQYVPQLRNWRDVVDKSAQIIEYFRRTKNTQPTYDPRVYGENYTPPAELTEEEKKRQVYGDGE